MFCRTCPCLVLRCHSSVRYTKRHSSVLVDSSPLSLKGAGCDDSWPLSFPSNKHLLCCLWQHQGHLIRASSSSSISLDFRLFCLDWVHRVSLIQSSNKLFLISVFTSVVFPLCYPIFASLLTLCYRVDSPGSCETHSHHSRGMILGVSAAFFMGKFVWLPPNRPPFLSGLGTGSGEVMSNNIISNSISAVV